MKSVYDTYWNNEKEISKLSETEFLENKLEELKNETKCLITEYSSQNLHKEIPLTISNIRNILLDLEYVYNKNYSNGKIMKNLKVNDYEIDVEEDDSLETLNRWKEQIPKHEIIYKIPMKKKEC